MAMACNSKLKSYLLDFAGCVVAAALFGVAAWALLICWGTR